MKIRTVLFIACMAVLFPLLAGCIVAEGPGYGHRESYYYYPDDEVYFYPNVQVYYWFEGGAWRHGPRPPARYVLRDRVRIDWDREPHRDHDKIRRDHPPRGDRDRDRDRDREGDRDRDRDRERDRR